MNKVVVNDPKFMVWFLKRKSRIKFLSMAVRHDFFKRNKDIRRYIAKWFFFDVVNILPRLAELLCKNYRMLSIGKASKLAQLLLTREPVNRNYKSVFEAYCQDYRFQRLYKSECFWGLRCYNWKFTFPKTTMYCVDQNGIVRFNSTVGMTDKTIINRKQTIREIDDAMDYIEKVTNSKKIKKNE